MFNKFLFQAHRIASSHFRTRNFHRSVIRYYKETNNKSVETVVYEEMKNFAQHFPKITQVAADSIVYDSVKTIYTDVLDYIRIPEQLNVAKVTLAIFNGFVPQPTWDDQTREELYALCWAIETMYHTVNFIDDYYDNSKLRYGQPCWHLLHPENKKKVPHMWCLMYDSVHTVLQHCIKDSRTTLNIQTSLRSALHNVVCADLCKPPMKEFSRETVNTLGKWRQGIYGDLFPAIYFNPPVFLAGYEKIPYNIRDQVQKACRLIANAIIVANDYYEFNKLWITAEESLDTIALDNWVLYTAINMVSDEQIEILKDCCTTPDSTKRKRISQIFHDLRIKDIFRENGKKSISNINKAINAIEDPRFRKAITDAFNMTATVYRDEYNLEPL